MSSEAASPAGASKKPKKPATTPADAKKVSDGDLKKKKANEDGGAKAVDAADADKKKKVKESGTGEHAANGGSKKQAKRQESSEEESEESEEAVESSSSEEKPVKPAKSSSSSSKKPLPPVPPKNVKASGSNSDAKKAAPAKRAAASSSTSSDASDESTDETTGDDNDSSGEEDDSEEAPAPVKKPSSKEMKPNPAKKDPKAKAKPQEEETSSDESPEPSNSTEETPVSTSTSDAKPKTTSKATGSNQNAAKSPSPPVPRAEPKPSSEAKPKDKKSGGGFFGFLKGSKKGSGDAKPSKETGAAAGDKDGAAKPVHKGDKADVTPPREDKKAEDKKTYVASCVAELPEEWQKKLKKSHLDEEVLNKHFSVLCNVLHFLTKDSFRMPDQEKDVRERRTYASSEMMEEAKKIIETTDNIKKFYKNIEFSGKGGFGRVFAAKDIATKKRVAIKKLPHSSDKDKKNNYCEIAFLSTCNHPNIVKFSKAWDFADKGEVWIVTEFLEGGTLSEAVQVHQFTERHIAYVAREILKALKYLHGMGYIHRDLKSGNVMMSIEGQIKLIDFGLCCDTIDGDRLQMLGSPYWIPPEMIKKKRHGCPADIWSFAVCVLEMYLKQPPNCDSRLYAMFTAASSGLKSAIPSRASDTARDFLSHCLEINPKKRWTAEQLLEHPFVTAAKLEDGIKDVLRGVFVSNSLALSGI